VTFVEVEAGHFGLIIGGEAHTRSWPAVFSFLEAMDRPEGVVGAREPGGGPS
jgi:hypothetical protein